MNSHGSVLTRGLTARHIRFMALGSAIGTGLFYGSSSAIQRQAPPSCWRTSLPAQPFSW
ncbi:hypothetical protein NHF46_20790 [Arthrobacter alpinus]|nr:hypothetical protein [Arthrobacter alpinus]